MSFKPFLENLLAEVLQRCAEDVDQPRVWMLTCVSAQVLAVRPMEGLRYFWTLCEGAAFAGCSFRVRFLSLSTCV